MEGQTTRLPSFGSTIHQSLQLGTANYFLLASCQPACCCLFWRPRGGLLFSVVSSTVTAQLMAAEESGQQFSSAADQIHVLNPRSHTGALNYILQNLQQHEAQVRCNIWTGQPGLFRDRTTLPGSLEWFASSVSPLLLYHNIYNLPSRHLPTTEHNASGFHVECRSRGRATSVITIPRFQATACLTILLSCPLCLPYATDLKYSYVPNS